MGRKKLLTTDKVLDAINGYIKRRGLAPTIEELRKKLKVASTRTVMRYLDELAYNGEIERWNGARGMKPVEKIVPKDGAQVGKLKVKDFHVYLPDALAETVRAIANSECRSVNQQILCWILKALEEIEHRKNRRKHGGLR